MCKSFVTVVARLVGRNIVFLIPVLDLFLQCSLGWLLAAVKSERKENQEVEMDMINSSQWVGPGCLKLL